MTRCVVSQRHAVKLRLSAPPEHLFLLPVLQRMPLTSLVGYAVIVLGLFVFAVPPKP